MTGADPLHTSITLTARANEAIVAAGLDPENVDLTIHASHGWYAVGIAHGEGDFTVKEARAIVEAIGGVPDGPPGNGFLHRRVDGIGFTVSHAKAKRAAA